MMVPVMAAIVVTASFQGRKRGAGGAGARGLLSSGRAAALGRDADRLHGPGGVVQVPAGIAFCDEEDAAGAQPRPEDVDALCKRQASWEEKEIMLPAPLRPLCTK